MKMDKNLRFTIVLFAFVALGVFAPVIPIYKTWWSLAHAETEPAPQAPAPSAVQVAPTADQQATAIVGQAVQGFLLYAPTTEAQRKLCIDSYNTVKAAMDRLAALEKPADTTPAQP